MSPVISRRVSFVASVEPGSMHDDECAGAEGDGCMACIDEMDEASEVATRDADGYNVLDIMLTNRPRGFDGERSAHADAFWEFDLTVRRR
jgi:hypothetical protein